ncbi:4-hydroxybenzoate 3-monooxygenase [Streptomyces sp. GC420]|uniref:4-hydroxybenzoate 3-monooxygenase n=1 Tax=Streptomyces sp. GC420 TaxID=2697568 RepID=UPI001414DEF8|nr:4-hydroxybenzoate 3-monooxygenase [Streptomyces sp. GC420]NBM15476.1 4-hydroxybenzoate 3-monooxygenase [Streptomyces sp. GC420]
MRTKVAVIGGGPAGLLLARLLHNAGIDCVVLENRTREYVEQRQRAGILEQGTVDVLREAGAGGRMDREGMVHHGIELRFDRRGHRIDFPALTGGRSVMVYPQTEVVKDLIERQLADGPPLFFEAEALAVEKPDSGQPLVRFRHEGREQTLDCDWVVGADGFHGIARATIPDEVLRTYERTYPFSWLGILADVPPSCEELIYARHARGFALHSMRSPSVSRLYLQVPNGTDPRDWSDERIWDELETRFELDGDWTLRRGPITQKSVTPMRSWVTEPMRHGRLLLAGDAAHIVPPTGAKGLNLAVSDVTLLARAFTHLARTGSTELLDAYSDLCLKRVWQATRFSYDMTTMLHAQPDESAFEHHVQLARLHRIADSPSAAAELALNYVGLPLDQPVRGA